MPVAQTDQSLLAARVKALRARRGWTVTETARRAGVSVSMLWKVENGQTELTYSKLAKLAEGLEVPIGELFAESAPALRKGGRRVVEPAPLPGRGPGAKALLPLHRGGGGHRRRP